MLNLARASRDTVCVWPQSVCVFVTWPCQRFQRKPSRVSEDLILAQERWPLTPPTCWCDRLIYDYFNRIQISISFQDGLDALYHRTEDVLKSLQEILGFFKKISELEKQYGADLVKIAKRYAASKVCDEEIGCALLFLPFLPPCLKTFAFQNFKVCLGQYAAGIGKCWQQTQHSV